MSRIEKAILLATKAHMGQKDKGGNPYILHPLRVMSKMKTESEMIVAVLHDVLEDTDVTEKELLEIGLTEEEMFALDCLTRREGESYDEFLYRVLLSDLSKKVKIEDIKDNLDVSRIPNMDRENFPLRKRYERALEILHGAGVTWFYGPSLTSRGRCSWFKKSEEESFEMNSIK